jgi:predicted methyltransferase
VEISKRQQSVDDDDEDDDAMIVLNREDVFAIEPDDLTVYTVVQTSEDAGDSRALAKLEPCRIYSNTIDRVCALCPSDSVNPELAPTALIAGFSMHRFGLGVDPKEDTRRKIASLKPYKGNNLAVLDVCTGLAYTAIMASELENVSSVTTIELDPTMTQLCAMNPHSKGLFGRAKNTTKKRSEDGGEDDYEKHNIISQLYGNAFDVIQTLPDRAFDRIIHDPPTFALAGELYGEKFYSELFRVLKPSGRVYHYTGDPSSNVAGGGGVRGIVKRMKLVGFESVEIDQHAHGVVAAKQPNVKFFSSGKKEKNMLKNAPNKRGKTFSSKRRDESFKGGRERRGGRGRNSSFDDDEFDEFDVLSSSSSSF